MLKLHDKIDKKDNNYYTSEFSMFYGKHGNNFVCNSE